jgi:1,4-dihydroxy-2-naphthoyl-CoA hydrolase
MAIGQPATYGIAMREDIQPPFANTLGIKVIRREPDRIEAELVVRPELGNRNGNLHGGAVMALADDLGGAATIINLPEDATTATIESKTNFFAVINVGDTARAECTALHKGRTTMVWQTRITRASDGRLAAIVTQTQLVISGKFGK